MLRLLWAMSVRIRYFLRRYKPTNILLDLIRTRRGLKWGIPATLLAVPYLLLASICANVIADGGPGWLNLLVLLFVWNALKFIVLGPISLALLIRVRIQEAVVRRRARRQGDVMESVAYAVLFVVRRPPRSTPGPPSRTPQRTSDSGKPASGWPPSSATRSWVSSTMSVRRGRDSTSSSPRSATARHPRSSSLTSTDSAGPSMRSRRSWRRWTTPACPYTSSGRAA